MQEDEERPGLPDPGVRVEAPAGGQLGTLVTTIMTTPPAPLRLDPPQQECLQRHMAELIDTRRPTYQPALKPGQKIADGTDKARGHFGQVVVE